MFIVYRGGEIRTQIVSWAADKERKAEGKNDCYISVIAGSGLYVTV